MLIQKSLDSTTLHAIETADWRAHLTQGLGNPHREALLVVWQLLNAWPRLRRRRAQQAEDLEDLVNLLRRSAGTSGLAAHRSGVKIAGEGTLLVSAILKGDLHQGVDRQGVMQSA